MTHVNRQTTLSVTLHTRVASAAPAGSVQTGLPEIEPNNRPSRTTRVSRRKVPCGWEPGGEVAMVGYATRARAQLRGPS